MYRKMIGKCIQENVYRKMYTGKCIQENVYRKMYTGKCIQENVKENAQENEWENV